MTDTEWQREDRHLWLEGNIEDEIRVRAMHIFLLHNGRILFDHTHPYRYKGYGSKTCNGVRDDNYGNVKGEVWKKINGHVKTAP